MTKTSKQSNKKRILVVVFLICIGLLLVAGLLFAFPAYQRFQAPKASPPTLTSTNNEPTALQPTIEEPSPVATEPHDVSKNASDNVAANFNILTNTLDSLTPTSWTTQLPVFMYHHVQAKEVVPEKFDSNIVLNTDFEEQVKYFSENGYKGSSVGEVLQYFEKEKKLPAKTVVLSFDDGYEDIYLYAFPILKKYNFHAELFLITALISKQPNYLKQEQVKEMVNSGLVTLGSHTVNHFSLTRIDPQKLETELVESKKYLENEYGVIVRDLCYPGGSNNATVQAAVKKAGYIAATLNKGNEWKPGSDDNFMVPRIRVNYGNQMSFLLKTFKH